MPFGNQNVCRPLDEKVRSIIRSGITITTVAQCVEELVLNSIDAEARYINITMNLGNFYLKVEDDGVGITSGDLDIIGTRHTTSKCHSVSDLSTLRHYGYRGEALSSIIEVSSGVEIISLTSSDKNCYIRKFKDGISTGVARKTSDKKRLSRGVTVIIHGLLAKFPVRQKRITLLEIEAIKKVLERIYLINFQITIDFMNQSTRIFHSVAKSTVISAFNLMYKKQLLEVFSSFNVFYFQGWFSKFTHHCKNLQMIYVNSRYISRNKIHRAVNMMLLEILGLNKNKAPDEGQRSHRENKYPIFVINIMTSLTEYDVTLEPTKRTVEFKNWDHLLKGVETLGCRFKSILQLETKNNCIVEGPQKSVQDQISELAKFGKSISIHKLKTALHSKIITRCPELPTELEGNSSSLKNILSSGTNQSSTNVDTGIHISLPSSSAQFKMSKYKSPPKQKLLGLSADDKEHKNYNLDKLKMNLGGIKRRAKGEPMFPNRYDKKPRMLCSWHPQPFSLSTTNPPLMNMIQELFPVFRDKIIDHSLENLEDKEEPKSKSPPTEIITNDRLESTMNSSTIGSTFESHNLLQLPREIEIEDTFTNENQKNPHIPSPHLNNLPENHLLGIIQNHLKELEKKFDIPNFTTENEKLLRTGVENLCHQESQIKENFFEQPLPPFELNFTTPAVIPSPPRYKTVPQILEMMIKNHRELNTGGSKFLEENSTQNPFPVVIGRGEKISDYWQRSEPIEKQIRRLEMNQTISKECRFQKEDLAKMRVIGQLDNKFIIVQTKVNGKDALALFDQHAVHERILLERLIDEISDNRNTTEAVISRIKCAQISPPIELELSDTEVRVISLYGKQFEMIGIQCEVVAVGQYVKIHTVPLCFIEKISTESKKLRDEMIVNFLQTSIHEQVRYIVETKGHLQSIPKVTFGILCSQACRGAIKFGDQLEIETCKELIQQLSKCKFPFQCAHGRPSLNPLLDLSSIKPTKPYTADIATFRNRNS